MLKLLGEIEGEITYFIDQIRTAEFEWLACRTRPGHARDEFKETKVEVFGHKD